MINQPKAVAYLRVNSIEHLCSIPAGSKILKDYLDSTPKVYEKIKYNPKCIQGIRAAIYYRTFGEKNIDKLKVAKLKKYAHKYNFKINMFIDYENNASNERNYELKKLLKMINKGQIEVLIVDSLCYLSSNIEIVKEILQLIEEKDVHLISLRYLEDRANI